MGWFSEVTDFLSSPAVRIGSGVLGLAAGAGAFEDMGDFGSGLTYAAGAANLASGAAAAFNPNASTFDQISGGLQMGLGGYNTFQQETSLPNWLGGGTVGGYGSFSTVFDRLTNPGDYEPFDFYRGAPDDERLNPLTVASGQRTNWQSGPSDLTRDELFPTTPSIGAPSMAPAGGSAMGPNITGSMSPGSYGTTPGSAPPASGLDAFDPGAYSEGALDPNDPARMIEARVDAQPMAPGLPVRVPTVTPQMAGVATPGVTPGFGSVVQSVARGAPAAVQAAVADIVSPRGGIAGFMDRIVNYAATNPVPAAMAVLQIGGMLSALFARSSADIAAEAMAQMSPNSADATEFRRLYEERARREITQKSEELRSQLQARFASRGMLKSTVFSSALTQLEQSRIELEANLPYNSMQAWNQVAAGMGNNMRSAAALGAASAPRTDFSNMARILGQSQPVQAARAG